MAEAEIITSDDGLEQTTKLDVDGDGIFEARGETVTTLNPDGSTRTVQESFDGESDLLATVTTVQSGNGLITTRTSADVRRQLADPQGLPSLHAWQTERCLHAQRRGPGLQGMRGRSGVSRPR